MLRLKHLHYFANCLVTFPKPLTPRSNGSVSVSGQLPAYSPSPKLTLTCYQLTVVELGEGQVGSCPDTDIDPSNQHVTYSYNTLTLSGEEVAIFIY